MLSMNALHNIHNPHQTTAKKVLCVCSAGLLRSPTTANVLHQEFGYNTRSAGIDESYALIPVSDLLLVWADEVVCMEAWQQKELDLRLRELDLLKPLICLYVPDQYEWNHPELREFILNAYKGDSNE